jgi:anti-sigma factor RsiW
VHCELTGIHLHAYLDGELDAAGAASFERHLQSCAECSSALSSEQSLRQALAGAQLYEPASAQLCSSVRPKLPAEFQARSLFSSVVRWGASAAALLLAALLGHQLLPLRSNADAFAVAAVDAHLRSLQPGHLTDVQSTDQHTVKPWFDGKIDFAPPVRDFAIDGFPLLGGRLDVLSGRTAAALVYGRRKHVINVFVTEPSRAAQAPGSGERYGYHWLFWQQDGFTYIAVSDVAPADLQQLRALFSKN